MNDDRFRSAIRSGLAPMIDEVDEGPDWDEVMAQFQPPWHRRLPGWAAAVAAAFAVLIGLGGLTLTLVGGSGSSTATTEAPTEPSSAPDLVSAVTAAAGRLHAAPGYEAIQRSFIDGHLAVSTWVSARAGGDMVAVQSVDRDVRDTGWWLRNGAVPPDEGENIDTTVTVRANGEGYRTELSTDAGGVWAPIGSQVRITPLAFDLAQLATTDWLTDSPTDVTVTRGTNFEVWTATAAYGDGSIVARWTLGVGGELESWSGRLLMNGPPSPDSADPTDTWTIDFTALTSPDPVATPDLISPRDLSALGLPPDFPLPTDLSAPTTQPPATTEPTLGFDHTWGLAYPPGWYRAGSDVMPHLGFRSITVSTSPIGLGGRCPQMPDNALRHMSNDDVLLTVFFRGAASGDSQPVPEVWNNASFPIAQPGSDAESCSDRTDLEIHWGDFAVGDQSVYVLLVFGQTVDASVRQTAWDVLGSLQNLGHVDGGNPGVCVVTLPGNPSLTPPDPYNSEPSTSGDAWYGSDQLWTSLPVDGHYETPRKSVWWSTNFPGGAVEGSPEIPTTWQRLDADVDPISLDAGTNAHTAADGWFMISGIDPDQAGCWQVTATYKGATLSYVYANP